MKIIFILRSRDKNSDENYNFGKVFLKKISDSDSALKYTGSFTPKKTGLYEFQLNHSLHTEKVGEIEIVDSTDELIDISSNKEYVLLLASQTNGKVISVKKIDTLLESIPSRAQIIPDDITETLYRSPAIYLMLTLLLGSEWFGRKFMKYA